MKKANLVLMAALAAAGLVGVAGGSLLPVSVAVAAEKEKAAPKQKLSPAVQKPLVAAQNAMTAKNWDEALVQIQAAQAVEPKTPYDAFMVDELGWYIYLQKKDYVKSAETLERSLATGMVSDADKPQRLRALTQMNLQNKQYDKAIANGTEYLKLSPNDAEIALALAQARYLSNDFKGAKAASEQLVASSPKPSEDALLLVLRSNYELKDEPGILRALEGLVRHYPAPKYWEDLLNAQLYRTKDDRGLRSLYRLMNDTDTLDKGEEYAEMGSTLVTGGFPNEAKQVLERGMARTSSRPTRSRVPRRNSIVPAPARRRTPRTSAPLRRSWRPPRPARRWSPSASSTSARAITPMPSMRSRRASRRVAWPTPTTRTCSQASPTHASASCPNHAPRSRRSRPPH